MCVLYSTMSSKHLNEWTSYLNEKYVKKKCQKQRHKLQMSPSKFDYVCEFCDRVQQLPSNITFFSSYLVHWVSNGNLTWLNEVFFLTSWKAIDSICGSVETLKQESTNIVAEENEIKHYVTPPQPVIRSQKMLNTITSHLFGLYPFTSMTFLLQNFFFFSSND